MSTARIDFEVMNQIGFVNRKLEEAIESFKAGETEEPFELKYYGPLYPQTIKYYRNRGYILSWQHNEANAIESYWSFTVPELVIDLENLR